ncbi:hypothetical protein NLG97_g2940 [Lecanicillium saksenae]|uniref:Uncharacterized protein n=1 Tax=Lecanicillium saksenae TaxID=468837 RepID=A0ACC1R054_9HYPO|nr:hypothetical protein NLG97_g2940 [Lecanicillium saksenae]
MRLKQISRRRKFPPFNRSTNPTPLQQAEADFLQAVLGSDSIVDAAPENAQATLCLFKRCVRGNWPADFDDVVTAEVALHPDPYHKAIITGQKVADAFRTHGGLSIVRLIKQLQADSVFRNDEGLHSNLGAQGLVFNAIGWISMLYQPSRGLVRTPGSNNFKIAVQSRQSSLRSSVPAEKAERPLDELLRACVGMFSSSSQTQKDDERNGSQDHLERKIQVSYLNAHVMKTLANMEFIWVDSISAHLDFDPTTPSVSIFRCPSFCKLHQSEESILAKMFVNMDEENEQPSNNFSAQNFVAEMQVTYRLLFRDDSRARKLYTQHERSRAAMTTSDGEGTVDPYLDDLCGKHLPNSWWLSLSASVRDSYDAEADFPIFKDRLKRIQDYMHGIQPNRFMSLWRDRRDLRIWYTIWVVIILGIISLISQFIALALSAAQLSIAQKSYAAQLLQNQSTK